jgi:hypothetical protein
MLRHRFFIPSKPQISAHVNDPVSAGTARSRCSPHADATDDENVHQRSIKESFMYGEIKKVRSDLGVGIIAAEDGRAYRFQCAEILNRRDDLEGQEVHFELGELKARDIIVLAGSPWTAFGNASL